MNCARIGAVNALIGANCLGLSVLTLVSLKLGAGEFFLGILSFAIFGTWTLRIFTMSAVEKYGKRKVIIFWKTVSVAFIVPFILLPFLVSHFSAKACLALVFTAAFVRGATYAFGNTGWLLLLQDIVPKQVTGRFFGNLRTFWQISSLITLLAIAWFLGADTQWWKFEVVFIVALLAYGIRVLTVIPMTENPLPETAPEKMSIFTRFREVLREKHLRRFALYIVTYMIAAVIAEPFKIKFLKDLGYSEGFIIAATAMVSLGAIVSLRFWGKLVLCR